MPRAFLKPRRPRGPDAEVIAVAERNGEKTGDGKTSGQNEGGGCGGRTRGAEQWPEPRKARRQVPYGILPCRPYGEKATPPKKEEWHNFRL